MPHAMTADQPLVGPGFSWGQRWGIGWDGHDCGGLLQWLSLVDFLLFQGLLGRFWSPWAPESPVLAHALIEDVPA